LIITLPVSIPVARPIAAALIAIITVAMRRRVESMIPDEWWLS
jgi:hypothetical protein